MKKVFSKRLYELRMAKGSKYTRQRVADELKISRASLEYYEKGLRLPDIEIAAKIADYFGVSTDYLLGRVQSKNFNTDFYSACEVTGLSEDIVKKINCAMHESKVGKIIFMQLLASALEAAEKLNSLKRNEEEIEK